MSFLDQLGLVFDFLLSVLTQIFSLYSSNPVLMSVFTLWILDRVFGIFNLVKG